DKEAQEGLESIWDLQNEKGAIFAGAGDAHWKDTAAAVYALIRQAELSQNWDFFKELYPDAFKGIMFLKDLRDKAYWNGTANGKYALLPQGFGDSGIGGIRSEYTNTLWALIALRALLEVADRFFLQKRTEIRDFYKDLRGAFFASRREEMRNHPKGFSYLPMLMKDDPQWQEKDERKQPRPQAAQIYMSQAIYPGLVFLKDDALVLGHIELMKAVTKEDLPIETGWLANEAVWPYNGAIVAQMYLFAGLPDLARKTFIGFLNHASPLYAWREEQSLLDAKTIQYIGDMPHNWASAECIRFLRHMMILEDEKNLRLFDGVGVADMNAMTPMGLTYSPTRWGRVTVTLDPVDKHNWHTKFIREDFDPNTMSKLIYVEMPRKLADTFYFDKITGAQAYRNGDRVLIPGEATTWECTWRSM
ncbi:MAG: hypothetical protein HY277_01645, partial [Ignavibacteriales bacterium]|nr:hypothetical protein [Ignavibacteriales bacterium]